MASAAACPGLSRLSWCQECAEMVPCEDARTKAVWGVLCINPWLIFRRRKGIKQSYTMSRIAGGKGSHLILIFDLELCYLILIFDRASIY